jgi:hypothetical protein
MPDLNQVLRTLHDSEIIVGIQTLSDGGVRVWLGDEMNAPITDTAIAPKGRKWPDEDAARWLHETAIRLYPDSKYATERLGRVARRALDSRGRSSKSSDMSRPVAGLTM